MTEPPPVSTPDDADQAVNAALQAEREAIRAIAECEQEAGRILEAARVRAQRIAARTDARIASLEIRCTRSLADTVETMLRQHAGQEAEVATPHAEALAEAVEQLAGRLTGAGGAGTTEPSEGDAPTR